MLRNEIWCAIAGGLGGLWPFFVALVGKFWPRGLGGAKEFEDALHVIQNGDQAMIVVLFFLIVFVASGIAAVFGLEERTPTGRPMRSRLSHAFLIGTALPATALSIGLGVTLPAPLTASGPGSNVKNSQQSRNADPGKHTLYFSARPDLQLAAFGGDIDPDVELKMQYTCTSECPDRLVYQIGFVQGPAAHYDITKARANAAFYRLSLDSKSGHATLAGVEIPNDIAIVIPNHDQGDFSGHGNEAIRDPVIVRGRVTNASPISLSLTISPFVFNPFRWFVGYDRYYLITSASLSQ